VVHAGVVMIRPAQQHHADAVLPLELFENLAGRAAHRHVVERVERAVAFLHRPMVLLRRQAQDVFELFVHLPLEEVGTGQVDEGVQEDHALFFEQVAFLGERRLHRRGSGRYGGARPAGLDARELARQAVDHGEENNIQRLLRMHFVQQVMDVRNAEFRREAGVDSAALGAFFVQFLAGEVGVTMFSALIPSDAK